MNSNTRPYTTDSLTTIDPTYEDAGNWENSEASKDKLDHCLPFRPTATSPFLLDAHYFCRKGKRRSIRQVGRIPPPILGASTEPSLESEHKWHPVCQQSLKFAMSLQTVASKWETVVPADEIDSLASARDAIKSYYNVDQDNFNDFTKELLPREEWQKESFGIVEQAFRQNQQTSPKLLYALYQAAKMHRGIISEHLTKDANDSAAGISASSWKFGQLVDLCCVPLFDVGLEAILPSDPKTLVKDVCDKIDSCYIVKRILKEITMATDPELTKFSTTHMSWFLLNPWCLFFTSLRDLLTRSKAEVDSPKKNISREWETLDMDENKLEASSEQLLHRFMEVVLLLFSILCGGRDEYRSTPGRADGQIIVGTKQCNILDDGYVYVTRGGTSGHPELSPGSKLGPNDRRPATTRPAQGVMTHTPADRNRYGGVPIIRYEAKRLAKSSNVHAQIFSELLSAAVMNMDYLNDTDPEASILPPELTGQGLDSNQKPSAPYHDAFVIHVHHYHLTIHTARFPADYLRWITNLGNKNSPKMHYCILYKVTASYNLADPTKRLEAARDILILLWAIRNGGPTKDGSRLFVARAVMRQSVGGEKRTGQKKSMQVENQATSQHNTSGKQPTMTIPKNTTFLSGKQPTMTPADEKPDRLVKTPSAMEEELSHKDVDSDEDDIYAHPIKKNGKTRLAEEQVSSFNETNESESALKGMQEERKDKSQRSRPNLVQSKGRLGRRDDKDRQSPSQLLEPSDGYHPVDKAKSRVMDEGTQNKQGAKKVIRIGNQSSAQQEMPIYAGSKPKTRAKKR